MAKIDTNFWGIHFPNPIWTAAGPGGADAEKLLQAARGGAGALVAKTISVKPAQVPIPNISSPFPGSLLNAELWSELDYEHFIGHELPQAKKAGLPLIASVGYSPEDLSLLGRTLQQTGIVDAVEFSVHYVGKDISNLQRTAYAVRESVQVPVLVKFSPTIAEIAAVVEALEPLVDGYVAVNSVGPALDFDIYSGKAILGSKDGRGWLSGRAILPIGLHFVATIASLTKKPVIGVGGIRTVEDVVKYIMAGASAVQVCSLAILRGQQVYGELATRLQQWMDRNGYTDLNQLRGKFLRRKKEAEYFFRTGTQLYPIIIYENCKYCDICVKSCMHDAIQFNEKIFDLSRKQCVSCGLCVSVCPYWALEMQPA
jgi:dihydroorotate dehydrogenase subfamily 1